MTYVYNIWLIIEKIDEDKDEGEDISTEKIKKCITETEAENLSKCILEEFQEM